MADLVFRAAGGEHRRPGAVVALLTEELFRGSALGLLFVFFRDEIDSAIDGILYGALVGFGFVAVENTLYFGGLLRVAAVLVGLTAGIGAHAIHNASVVLGPELGWPCLVALASKLGWRVDLAPGPRLDVGPGAPLDRAVAE